MLSREILNSHTVPTLRQEISKTNFKGFYKMTKPQLVDLMMKNKEKFDHIKMREIKLKGAKAPPGKFNLVKKAPAPAHKTNIAIKKSPPGKFKLVKMK